MSDPIFAVIEEAKRLQQLWERIDQRAAVRAVPEAERSNVRTTAENAREAWEAALKRVKDAEATTLTGLFARLDYLSECGECDYETVRDLLTRIAERQPDLTVA